MARLSAVARVGLGLILIGPAWFGIWACWDATRIWKPLDVPITLLPGHLQTPEFKTNVSSSYSVEIELVQTPGLDFGAIYCLLGVQTCADNPSLVDLSWSLSDGRDNAATSSLGHCAMCRKLGGFRAGHGHFALRADILRDGSRLNGFEPHLVVWESGGERERASAEMDRGVWLFLLLGPVGAVLFVRSTMRRRREWLRTLAMTSSLTQPLPKFQAPALDIVAPRLTRRVPKYRHRRLGSLNRPSFTRVYCTALAVVMCLLVVAAPVWHEPANRPVPKGWWIHLWRPETRPRTNPVMPPLVVRLTLPRHNGRPNLYVDSEPVSWQDLDSVLRQKLAHYPPHWPIYLDGDPGLEWRDAVEAIDTIRGVGADVILLARQPTPAKMRDH